VDTYVHVNEICELYLKLIACLGVQICQEQTTDSRVEMEKLEVALHSGIKRLT